MTKHLVVVESPTKAKKIQSYIGSDYEVVPSYGHVIDLPEKKISVDIKKQFKPTYDVMPDKTQVLDGIKKKAAKIGSVILMSDPDREGDAIANHIASRLDPNVEISRAKSNEITKTAIVDAIKNKYDLNKDINNFYAYEARRILDRLCGYKTSFITKQGSGGSSAGRVQSAGLRILTDREKEIIAFVPVVYWPIEAEVLTVEKDKIKCSIRKPKALDIKSKEEADEIINELKKGPVKVTRFDKADAYVSPYAPFTTSTLQQAASTYLGFSPDRTMKVAQGLFELSLITYHRTDSTNISTAEVPKIRNLISSNYPKEYISKTALIYNTKNASAQQAHEAIRPTDCNLKQYIGGSGDEKELYELIWKRTIACQMSQAKYLRSSADFSSKNYVLGCSGSKQLFDGFRKVWDYSSSSDTYLPELNVGDKVDVIDIKTERKETEPPSRYREASFVDELEKRGIGRPSTYASIIKTLKDRKYVEDSKKSLQPTDLGMKVMDFLTQANFCFVDLDFTSEMEKELDDIAEGNKTKLDVLNKFWKRLSSDLLNASSIKDKNSITKYDCEECLKNNVNSKMKLKFSKFGPFLSCSKYPECKNIVKVDKDGIPIKEEPKKKEYSDICCAGCGNKMVIRTSKKGSQYLGCENFSKNDKCKGFFGLDGSKIEFSGKKKFYKKWKKKE